MAKYSRTFAHIGRAKAADYRARVKASKAEEREPQVEETPEAPTARKITTPRERLTR